MVPTGPMLDRRSSPLSGLSGDALISKLTGVSAGWTPSTAPRGPRTLGLYVVSNVGKARANVLATSANQE
jgi:hypothetical protein